MSQTISIGPSRHSFPLTALLRLLMNTIALVVKICCCCGKILTGISVNKALIFSMTYSQESVRPFIVSMSLQTGSQPPVQPSKCSSEQ